MPDRDQDLALITAIHNMTAKMELSTATFQEAAYKFSPFVDRIVAQDRIINEQQQRIAMLERIVAELVQDRADNNKLLKDGKESFTYRLTTIENYMLYKDKGMDRYIAFAGLLTAILAVMVTIFKK